MIKTLTTSFALASLALLLMLAWSQPALAQGEPATPITMESAATELATAESAAAESAAVEAATVESATAESSAAEPVPMGQLLTGNPWVERIQERGTLRVGFDIFRPWVMQAKNGDYLGFEVQVAKALAGDMGVKLEFVPTAWDGIIPALLTGRFDIIIGGMGITPERARKVAFTEPYIHAGMSLAASQMSAPNLTSLEDFNKPHIKIAVKGGTTAAIAAKKTFPLANIVEYDDEGQTAQELRGGRAQALVASAPYPAEQALKNPEYIYIPVGGTFAQEPCGMALSLKNKDALPALDAWIGARFASGWLKQTRDYWFESIKWESQLD